MGYCYWRIRLFILILLKWKEMATHSSILARRIPWIEEPGRLHTVYEVASVGHNLATKPPHSPSPQHYNVVLISAIKQSDSVVHAQPDTHTHTRICARSDRQGQGSLAWCSPWGQKESDTTELLNSSHFWSHLTACGILVLQPDFELVPLALEVQRVLTTAPPEKPLTLFS